MAGWSAAGASALNITFLDYLVVLYPKAPMSLARRRFERVMQISVLLCCKVLPIQLSPLALPLMERIWAWLI